MFHDLVELIKLKYMIKFEILTKFWWLWLAMMAVAAVFIFNDQKRRG